MSIEGEIRPPLTVEVVLCTFNGEAWIEAQIQSILNQSRRVDRISIYDDLSSDCTLAVVARVIEERRSEATPEMAVHRNDVNLGYAGNFAQGVAAAKCDIVFLCDQDDVWHVDKVARIMRVFEYAGSRVDLVFTDGVPVDQQGRTIYSTSVLEGYGLTGWRREALERDAFRQFMRRNYVNGAACALRRSTAQAALPIPRGWPHDYWFAIWAAMHGGLMLVDEVLYSYRQHHSNAIGLGSDRALYQLLGVWRQPHAPRLREREMCAQLLERMRNLPPLANQSAFFQSLVESKLSWLDTILDSRRTRIYRAICILRSIVCGTYGLYSPPDAPIRDIVGLLRG